MPRGSGAFFVSGDVEMQTTTRKRNTLDIVLDMLCGYAQEDEEWRISEGYEIDTKTEEITKGNIGQKEWDSPIMQDVRRDHVEAAVLDLVNGKEESTIQDLRNDLEQYGGTNDVTLVNGDDGKGIVHIEKRHGYGTVPFVLEAMANGKIVRSSRGNKTVAIRKDGYEAILSLEEYGEKKTWLLTGYRVLENDKQTSFGCTRQVLYKTRAYTYRAYV